MPLHCSSFIAILPPSAVPTSPLSVTKVHLSLIRSWFSNFTPPSIKNTILYQGFFHDHDEDVLNLVRNISTSVLLSYNVQHFCLLASAAFALPVILARLSKSPPGRSNSPEHAAASSETTLPTPSHYAGLDVAAVLAAMVLCTGTADLESSSYFSTPWHFMGMVKRAAGATGSAI